MSRLDDEARREIVGRAQTLVERLDADRELDTGGRVDVDGRERLARWEDQFPDEDAFEERLDSLGVTRETCVRAFEQNRLSEGAELPAWIHRIEAVADYVQSDDRAVADADGSRSDRAFDSLVRAVSGYLRANETPPVVEDTLSESALDDAVAWFERRFHRRFVRVLYVEFKLFVASVDEDLAFADPDEFDDPPTECYERFRAYLHDGGFVDLCFDYPMAARLLATQIRQWREHLTELARRIDADRPALAERLGDGSSLGPVVELEPLADDTHGDGRAVTRVVFDDGPPVVYKPRSVTAGRVFYDLLTTVAESVDVPSFDAPWYLERDEYGWMEWIDPEPCRDEAAVRRYYRRAGALVCVAYLCEFTDCHYENVVAAGEHPTVVDAETLFHPHVDADRKVGDGQTPLSADSVLLSLLPPFESGTAHDDAPGPSLSVAGLGVSDEPATFESFTTSNVEAVNTDVMNVEQVPARIRRDGNVPSLDGTACPPDDYHDALVDGFRTVYEATLSPDSELDLRSLIESVESFENRVVYRATQQYAGHIESLGGQEPLSDGGVFGAELDQMAAPFCTELTPDPPWGLFAAERVALRRLDPPRFTSRPDETTIHGPTGPTGETATASGLARARDRIASTSEADLREQVELLRGCCGLSPSEWQEPAVTSPRPITDERLTTEAVALYDRVTAAATRSSSGRYQWSSVAPWNETERLLIRPSDSSLYIGKLGMALFAGTLAQITGGTEHRSFAATVAEPIARAVTNGRRLPALENHGAASGIGSVAYALAALGDLTDSPALSAAAADTAAYVTPAFVERDTTYDVVGGSAGTLLGLLGAYDRTGDERLLDASRLCGDHLVETRVETDTGDRAWPSSAAPRPLCGFAHGTAGTAYALARLGDATGSAVYTDAALEAIAYESAQYDPELDNWPDFRPDSGKTDIDQWCHGRTGVGMARLGTRRHVDSRTVERDLDRVLDGVQSELLAHDHVCCGNAGRALFHVAAADELPSAAPTGRELLGGVIERDSSRTLSQTDAVCEPTLFHGAAGIGFAAARAVAPDATPTLLLWR